MKISAAVESAADATESQCNALNLIEMLVIYLFIFKLITNSSFISMRNLKALLLLHVVFLHALVGFGDLADFCSNCTET